MPSTLEQLQQVRDLIKTRHGIGAYARDKTGLSLTLRGTIEARDDEIECMCIIGALARVIHDIPSKEHPAFKRLNLGIQAIQFESDRGREYALNLIDKAIRLEKGPH